MRIRFSSIGSQLEKIGENAEQSFMTLKDTFDLNISPSDLVASVREELIASTGVESVHCPYCQSFVNVSVGSEPGSTAPNVLCFNAACRKGFSVQRDRNGHLSTSRFDEFYVVCTNCENPILVRPQKREGIVINRYCFECCFKHFIDVTKEEILKNTSEFVKPIELPITSLLNGDIYLCPVCQKRVKHPTRANTKRGDILHLCPFCTSFLKVKTIHEKQVVSETPA